MMWEQNKTFQELADEIGLEAIFSGTEADEATMNAFLEWLFDYRLCSDNDNTFLRYFRRRFNNLYPRYLEQLRILSVKENFDPYVTDYFQDVISRVGTNTTESEKNSEGGSGSTVTNTKGAGSTTVRTPNLTTHNIGENVVNGESSSTDSGTDSTSHTGTETTANNESGESTTESTTDSFGIAYPEANLGSIPLTIPSQRNIEYANSETLGLAKSKTNNSSEGENTVTHNTTDETTHGLKNVGTVETTTNDELTQTQTGNETTVVTNSGSDTQTTENTNSATDNENRRDEHSDEERHEHKGRNESVADIIPRAVKAITSTNELMWFIDSMKVCFDCTSMMY